MVRVARHAFSRLFENGRRKFMPYYPVGYPTLEQSVRNIRTLLDAGADALELGVPFSDPLADGPILQEASAVAVANNVQTADVIQLAATLREEGCEVPLIMMGYLNPFLAYGTDIVARNASSAGLDGLLVPDLPFGVASALRDRAREAQLLMPSFIAPTTSQDRLREVVLGSEGFLYAIAVTGTTGFGSEEHPAMNRLIASVRSMSNIPIAIGFGIRGCRDAVLAAQRADAVIVGSALIRAWNEGPQEFAHLAHSLADAIHSTPTEY